ncbi:MAG: N-acetylmuramoyl-L-alanine amidase [Blastocatellia bacterium]
MDATSIFWTQRQTKICQRRKEVSLNMPHSLIWLPDVLKSAGLKVSLVNGWENRGRGNVGNIFGILCHHTAGPKNGNMPSLETLIKGRSNLPGPLSQLGLGRDGTYYVIAAGRCNHAGKGFWKGITSGNTNFIGIEAENAGVPSDPWPEAQMNAYRHGVAAMLKHIGRGAEFCAGHKEYALPRGRKPDPSFDMEAFRSSVAAILNGGEPPLALIPSVEPAPPPGAPAARPTLRRGSRGDFVKQVQTKLGIGVDGDFGPKMEAKVREFQRAHDLVPDGIFGPKSWSILDTIAAPA